MWFYVKWQRRSEKKTIIGINCSEAWKCSYVFLSYAFNKRKHDANTSDIISNRFTNLTTSIQFLGHFSKSHNL